MKNKSYFVGQIIPEGADNSQESSKKLENNQNTELHNSSEEKVPQSNTSQVLKPEDLKTKKISDGSHYC